VHIAPAAGADDYCLATREYKYEDMVIEASGRRDYVEGFGDLSTKRTA